MGALNKINAMGQAEFVACLGPVFENSPWVAAQAWSQRPFNDVASLHSAMFNAVRAHDQATQLAFLGAHPDLAGREARQGTMTVESTAEQQSAGLNHLSAFEAARLDTLNRDYRDRHGFPFIICARHYTKSGIMADFEYRLTRETAAEFAEALRQISYISSYRLDALCAALEAAEIAPAA